MCRLSTPEMSSNRAFAHQKAAVACALSLSLAGRPPPPIRTENIHRQHVPQTMKESRDSIQFSEGTAHVITGSSLCPKASGCGTGQEYPGDQPLTGTFACDPETGFLPRSCVRFAIQRPAFTKRN